MFQHLIGFYLGHADSWALTWDFWEHNNGINILITATSAVNEIYKQCTNEESWTTSQTDFIPNESSHN